MVSYFDFHDAVLDRFELSGTTLRLQLRAILISWEEDVEVGEGKSFRQDLELVIEECSLDESFTSFPVWLQDGEWKASWTDAPDERVPDWAIPNKMKHAKAVELKLEGEEESTGDFKKMRIRGAIASLSLKGAPVFLQVL